MGGALVRTVPLGTVEPTPRVVAGGANRVAIQIGKKEYVSFAVVRVVFARHGTIRWVVYSPIATQAECSWVAKKVGVSPGLSWLVCQMPPPGRDSHDYS